MEKNNEMETCQTAVELFGIDAQEKMCIEECSELINAIAKRYRGRTSNQDIITELADVSIMVDQLALFYGYEEFKKKKKKKIIRLNDRINKHGNYN